MKAECSDLDSTECAQWSQYCEWDEDTDQCTEIGGGGGDLDYGPFDFSYLRKWTKLLAPIRIALMNNG